jgi:DNA processing protein
MAVPGSPLDARCLGSNNRLRDGASLVETADDVLGVLRPLIERPEMAAREKAFIAASASAPPSIGEADRQALIELMGPVPMGVDELIKQSQMPVPQVHLVLLELDLAGRLTQEAGGKICLL